MKLSLTTFLQKVTEHPKTSSLFLGSLLACALPPYFQFWAMFVSFSGALFLCSQTKSAKSLAALGYWFGFSYYAIGFYWIGNALLVDIVKTGWLYLPVLLLNGAFFGLFTILPFVATKLGKNTFAKILFFAATWCIFNEYAREYILTGFPWNPISSMLAFRPKMLQTLAYLGTNGLSLVAVLIGALSSFWLIKPCRTTFLSIVITLVCLAALWEYGQEVFATRPQIPNGHSLMVRLVQPSIKQSLKWSRESVEKNLQDYVDLSLAKSNKHVDLVVWGETASSFDLTADKAHLKKVQKAIPRNGYLITGFLRIEEDLENKITLYNSLGVIDSKGNLKGIYDKNHLVPFGEYIPLRKYMPQWVKPVVNMIADFGRGIKYQTIKLGKYPAFAPLICYEVIFSGEIVQQNEKPQWLVVLTNDGWYGNSSGPYQHLVAAKMRAIEEGVTIVRSANNGISAVITPYGTVRKSLPLNARSIVDVIVKPNEARSTLFGAYGNLITLALAGVVYLLAFAANFLSKK